MAAVPNFLWNAHRHLAVGCCCLVGVLAVVVGSLLAVRAGSRLAKAAEHFSIGAMLPSGKHKRRSPRMISNIWDGWNAWILISLNLNDFKISWLRWGIIHITFRAFLNIPAAKRAHRPRKIWCFITSPFSRPILGPITLKWWTTSRFWNCPAHSTCGSIYVKLVATFDSRPVPGHPLSSSPTIMADSIPLSRWVRSHLKCGLKPTSKAISRCRSHLKGGFKPTCKADSIPLTRLIQSRWKPGSRLHLEWGFDFTWNGGSTSLGRRILYQFEGGFYLTFRNKASSISLRKRIQTHLQYGFDVSWNVGSISLGRRVYLSRSEAEFDLT